MPRFNSFLGALILATAVLTFFTHRLGAVDFTPSSAVSVVDVMVIHTAEARAAAGGSAAMEDLIRASIAEANLIFENSRARVRVRLVHHAEIDYIESRSLETDIEHLHTPGDGSVDEALVWRDEYQADLVCMVVEDAYDFEFYGLQGPSAANAFSAIRRRSLTGSYVFPVTLSFNFGCQLDRPNSDSAGAFSFSHGHTFRAEGQWFGTIESFSVSRRLPFFSNPDLLFLGEAGGVPIGMPLPSNNAKTLNDTASIVAGFRGDAPSVDPPRVLLLSPVNGSVYTAGATLRMQAAVAPGTESLSHVDFQNGTTWLASVMSAPYESEIVLTNVGVHWVSAVAVDAAGVSSVSQPALITVRPANDDFDNAFILDGFEATASGSCRSATLEPGESANNQSSAYSRDKTVWWRWTAPLSGRVLLTAHAWPSFSINTSASVGSRVPDLSPVKAGGQSIEFDVTAGVTYHIAVGANSSSEGDFTLRLRLCPVELLSPADGMVFEAGSDILVVADLLGGTTTVDFQSIQLASARFGSLLTTSTNVPLSFLWTNVPPGEYELYAFALDGSGDRLPSMPSVIRVPPANDDFTDRLPLTSFSNQFTTTIAGASLEPGETGCDDEPGSGTVWWAFTSPGKGRLALDWSFKTSVDLKFFEGNKLSELVELPSLGSGTLRTAPEVDYVISACGPPQTITVNWSWTAAPANDDFSNGSLLAGANLTNTADLTGATIEVGEPVWSSQIGSSVWFSWTAPASGRVVLSGDPKSARVAVYTGTELSDLNLILSKENVDGSFVATAGTVYHIAIYGNARAAYAKTWALRLESGPPNDQFANRSLLTGSDIVVAATNDFATKEPGEPDHADNPGGASLWWSWTAPADGSLTLTVSNQIDVPLLALYTGEVLTNLVLVPPNRTPGLYTLPTVYFNFDTVFEVRAGQTYQIAADSRSSASYSSETPAPRTGEITFALRFTSLHLVSPANGDYLNWPANIVCAVGPIHSLTDGQINRVDYYHGTNWLASAGPPFSVPLPNLQPGRYSITAVATNVTGTVLRSLPHEFSLVTANDMFADRLMLDGNSALVVGNNAGATKEEGEPLAGSHAFGQTLWWSWTAPADGTVTISEDEIDFMPALSIFTGEGLTNLSLLASNSYRGYCDYSGDWTNHFLPLNFTVRSGQTFHLSVDSYQQHSSAIVLFPPPASGSFALRWTFSPVPANDNFADRIELAGGQIVFTNSNHGASAEPGEPDYPYSGPASHSIWYSWTAPSKGLVTIDTVPPNPTIEQPGLAENVSTETVTAVSVRSFFDGWPYCNFTPPIPPPQRVFAIYRGSSLTSLSPVAFGAHFFADAGETFAIACDGVQGTMLEAPFHLRLHERPANDDFDRSFVLDGTGTSGLSTLFGATLEAGEPPHNNSSYSSTVWWTWTAPFTGPVRVLARQPDYPQANHSVESLTIYVGNHLDRLHSVPWDWDTQTFYAREGTTYRIAVVGQGTYYTGQEFVLSISPASTAPVISSADSAAYGIDSFAVGVSGQTGQAFLIQASTNLVVWEDIGLDTVLGGLTRWIDEDAARHPQRFYRVVPLESRVVNRSLGVEATGWNSAQGFGLRVSGPEGQPYLIQTSTNLLDWTDLSSGILFGDGTNWVDPESSNINARYYRVIPWP